jgi:hypothetical protein
MDGVPFGLLGDLFVRRSRHCYGVAGSNSASKKDLAGLDFCRFLVGFSPFFGWILRRGNASL